MFNNSHQIRLKSLLAAEIKKRRERFLSAYIDIFPLRLFCSGTFGKLYSFEQPDLSWSCFCSWSLSCSWSVSWSWSFFCSLSRLLSQDFDSFFAEQPSALTELDVRSMAPMKSTVKRVANVVTPFSFLIITLSPLTNTISKFRFKYRHLLSCRNF